MGYISILHCSNPVGAHTIGEIDEYPNSTPESLMSYLCQFVVGKQEKLRVWSDDYATPDRTGERDYLHVAGMAIVFVTALEYMEKS